jgi:hypothetical protein
LEFTKRMDQKHKNGLFSMKTKKREESLEVWMKTSVLKSTDHSISFHNCQNAMYLNASVRTILFWRNWEEITDHNNSGLIRGEKLSFLNNGKIDPWIFRAMEDHTTWECLQPMLDGGNSLNSRTTESWT